MPKFRVFSKVVFEESVVIEADSQLDAEIKADDLTAEEIPYHKEYGEVTVLNVMPI